jgi:hypothetical protein
MDIRSAFPSKYVKASDLQGKDVRVIIGQVAMEQTQADAKPVLYFQGREKALVLNLTNANTIADMYGDDTDNWIGKPITLFATRIDMKGERVDAIRIRFVQPPPVQQRTELKRKASEPVPLEQTLSEEMNDEIPW